MKYIETKGAFYCRLLTEALPVTVQSVITIGVNLADNVMLGQLGETALSASALGTQFVSLFQFLCMGISMGASVLIARCWGAGRIEPLKKVVTIALRMSLFIALAFTVVSAAVPRLAIGIYSADEVIVGAGAVYLRWSAPTFVLMALSLVCTNVLRSVSSAHIPFFASLAAFFINIGANYLFIFGKFGAPRMEIAGAALGTVLARIVETGVICGCFFLRDRKIRYRAADLCGGCREMLREFFRISIPVMISDTLLGVGDSALTMIMGHIGAQFVSAHSITMAVQRVSTLFITGLSYAACIIIGQTLGKGDLEQTKRQGTTFVLLGTAIGALAGLIICFVRDPILGAYQITEQTREISRQLMDSLSLIIVFRALSSLLTKGVLRGGGDTRFLLAADLSTMWLIAVPLGALAGLVWKLPAFWVFFALHFDHVVKVIVCLLRMKSGRWIQTVRTGRASAAENGGD